ncbi:MAG: GGDEF domain-containing protein [Bradymonadia bacterium]
MKDWTAYLKGGWSVVEPWALTIVCGLGVVAHLAGIFDPESVGVATFILGICLAGGVGVSVKERLERNGVSRAFADYEDPALWVLALWAVLSVVGLLGGELFIVAICLVAWVCATQPRQSVITALSTSCLLEVALWANGVHSPGILAVRLALLGSVAAGLHRFAMTEAFRHRLLEVREQNSKREIEIARARDFGLLTAQAPILQDLPVLGGKPKSDEQESLRFLDESFDATLSSVRVALNATSAVILWRTVNGFTKSAHVSGRSDVMDGPFHVGKGLPASVLADVHEVALDHVRENYEGLPYYARPGGVGSAFAIAIGQTDEQDTSPLGVLCVDRVHAGPWTDTDRLILRAAVRKVALDVATSQRLKAAENEKSIVRRFCAALGELNKSLGIEGTAKATFEAVREMAKADLMVITLANGSEHRVVAASGTGAGGLKNMKFDGADCLVGKAVEVQQTLPLSGQYRGHGTVFGPGENLDEMRSLMVIPLVLPSQSAEMNRDGLHHAHEETVVGALTVAAQNAEAFGSPAREMIQLIARQVAIKLNLADAHEQIREMAKTDPMTGLANERSFDHAFSNMLSRAERRGDSLCLVMTDIDKFKSLNDTYGHPFGDEVIKAVANRLQEAVRSVDLAARIGGEEFALLLEDSDMKGAFELAERIRSQIENMVLNHPEKGPVQLTLSMGVAEYPSAGENQAQLMEMADKALYLAKNSGRNQVRRWTELESVSVPQVAQVGTRH